MQIKASTHLLYTAFSWLDAVNIYFKLRPCRLSVHLNLAFIWGQHLLIKQRYFHNFLKQLHFSFIFSYILLYLRQNFTKSHVSTYSSLPCSAINAGAFEDVTFPIRSRNQPSDLCGEDAIGVGVFSLSDDTFGGPALQRSSEWYNRNVQTTCW